MPNKTNLVHVKLENTKILHFLDINQERKIKSAKNIQINGFPAKIMEIEIYDHIIFPIFFTTHFHDAKGCLMSDHSLLIGYSFATLCLP